MKNIILKLGQLKIIFFITSISILFSLFVYLVISFIFDIDFFMLDFILSIAIPMIVSPIISWYFVKLIFQISELENKMRNLATYDSLTNLLQRQAFLDGIELLYKFIKRKKGTLVVFYIDVDNFKSINDTYGHVVGDKVLKSLGKILETNKRESDLVGRLGGEEFAFALVDIDLKGALYFAEKLRKLIENDIFENDGISINYTISMGISTYSENNEIDVDRLVLQADTALYQAKLAGKNCIKVYQI